MDRVVNSASRNDLLETGQIDCLLEAAGADGVQEILDAFWRSTDDLLAILEKTLTANDFTEASKVAHALKGSSANVGASLLSLAARAIEQGCRSADGAESLKALDETQNAYAQTRAAFEAYIGEFRQSA